MEDAPAMEAPPAETEQPAEILGASSGRRDYSCNGSAYRSATGGNL